MVYKLNCNASTGKGISKNYFRKLKINPVIEIQGRRFRKCQKENVIPQSKM